MAAANIWGDIMAPEVFGAARRDGPDVAGGRRMTGPAPSPEILPVLAALAVFPMPIAAALLYSGHLHRNRERLYATWLARR